MRHSISKGKNRSTSPSSSSSNQGRRQHAIEAKLKRNQSTSSGKSDRSQLVDLVVEDTEAEEAERVRARKEGDAAWNESQQRHFVRTYSIGEDAPEGQQIREGFDPSKIPAKHPPPEHAVSEEEDNAGSDDDDSPGQSSRGGRYGSLVEEDNVWNRS